MDCQFQGVVIPPGKKVPVKAFFDEDLYETLHFTQAALGEKAKSGPHTIFIEKEGQRYAIGTLDIARCSQFSCDITFSMDEVVLSHNGASDVYLTGYRVEQMMGDGSDEEYPGYGSDEGSGEEDEEDGEESEDEEAPKAVPLVAGGGKPPQQRLGRLVDVEAEESSDEEGEQERRGALAPFGNGQLGQSLLYSSEEESLSSGEEEEEEESEEEAPNHKEAQRRQQPPQQQQAQQQGTKRSAEQAAAGAHTPLPAKKAKGEPQHKAPATAPAKVELIKRLAKEAAEKKAAAAAAEAAAAGKGSASGPTTPSNEKEYLQALKAALQAAGQPLKLAALGAKVKRPPSAPKFKNFIDKHPGVFKYNKDADTVALA